MPEHHLYKIWLKLRLHGEKCICLVFGGEHFFIKRHVHVPTCTWGMWSENMECRVDTHGAMKKKFEPIRW